VSAFPRWITLAGLLLGATLAPLLAYNQTPSPTLYNQLLAFLGWGLVLLGLGLGLGLGGGQVLRGGWRGDGVSGALLLMALVALVAPGLNGLPWSMALGSLAMLGGAALVLQAGRAVAAGQREAVMTAFCLALVAAGLLSVGVSLVQVFWPALAEGNWIARSGVPGRAVGNMRQPNHLASLLMWACVALVWLHESGWLARRLGDGRRAVLALALLMQLLVLAVVLSASRTGMIGVGLLALWGLLNGVMPRSLGWRFSRAGRWVLMATPLMLALSWELLAVWTQASGQAFGAEARLAEGAGSPSRVAILSNAWALLQRYPLTGTGWGDFNLAWTLTPFPDRPIAFFDHTHNLPMQLLVELGWPLGLSALALLAWGFVQLVLRALRHRGASLRCAAMLVLMIGLHSLLEYPLWYAYFLLPTAFAVGLCLGGVDDVPAAAPAAPAPQRRPVLALAGLAMALAVPAAVWDYQRVVAIYAPPKGSAPLPERMALGQQSWLFAPQADYAVATVLPPGEQALQAARRTGHHLIDVRLMMAWARSLEAVGQEDQARYLVQRLKEFRSKAGDDWLMECHQDLPPGELPPLQCQPPLRDYDYRELR
jgi:hypothetical protein